MFEGTFNAETLQMKKRQKYTVFPLIDGPLYLKAPSNRRLPKNSILQGGTKGFFIDFFENFWDRKIDGPGRQLERIRHIESKSKI